MKIVDEGNIEPIEEMTRIADSFLNLALWGFKRTYLSKHPGKLIYDSEACRINIVWGGADPLGGNSISIYYGRLHASNEKATMNWKGEECYCWHRFELALHFLDRCTPGYASKKIYTHSLIEQYKQSDLGKNLAGERHQPEWLARMHNVVWQQYGKRLFDLFDLQHPNLWEQYQYFLKEVYDIKGRSPNIKPSLDKVC